jgi:cytochrome c
LLPEKKSQKSKMKKLVVTLFLAVVCGVSAKAQEPSQEVKDLMAKHTCSVCHKADVRVVGPAYKDVAKKKYTPEQIVELVYNPKPEHWAGYPPMAALKNVPKEDIIKIAGWINSLGGKAKGKGKKKA